MGTLGPSSDELSRLPPAYQAVLREVIANLLVIQRTGWGTIHVELKDHKKWNVRGSVSAASSTPCNN